MVPATANPCFCAMKSQLLNPARDSGVTTVLFSSMHPIPGGAVLYGCNHSDFSSKLAPQDAYPTNSYSQNQTHSGVRCKDTAKGRLWVTEQRICVFLLFGLFQPLLPLTHAQLHILTPVYVIPAHKPGDIRIAYFDKLTLNYGSAF